MKIIFFLWVAAVAIAGDVKPCVFCEIASGRRAAPEVYRDDTVVAFMDHAPRNPGHVLIVPVRHADNYLELPPATLEKMIVLAQRIGQAIRRTDLNSEGIAVQMNTGKAAGQSVFHAHLHVIPRFTGDDRVPHTEKDIVPPEELEKVAAKIRAQLR